MTKHKMSVTPMHVNSHQGNSLANDKLQWQESKILIVISQQGDCAHSPSAFPLCTHYEMPTGHDTSLENEGWSSLPTLSQASRKPATATNLSSM
jgi:hypothetical protein